MAKATKGIHGITEPKHYNQITLLSTEKLEGLKQILKLKHHMSNT